MNMKKSMMLLYLLPTVVVGMFLVYCKENLLTWLIFLLGSIFPVVVTCLCIRNHWVTKNLVIGNLVFFSTNMILIQILNKINLAKDTGLMWHGYFKPFYTEHLFIIIFIFIIIAELISCSFVKKL